MISPVLLTSLSRLGGYLRHALWSHSGLLALLAVSAWERVAFLRWWRAFPGGDSYNFILIAQELLRGSYPIAEKRLPVYPLLIALAHAVFDWETAGVVVALLSSLVAIALLYGVGRTLGVSKTALLVALLPFQAVAPFLFQSVRGYADTTFVALTLGALLAFLRSRTKTWWFLTGGLLGAAALTRFEGTFWALAVLGLCVFRRPFARFLANGAGFALCLLPFLLLSLAVGRPLAPAEYFADAAATAFGVRNIRDFVTNYAVIWQSVGVDRAWQEPRRLVQEASVVRLGALPRRALSFLGDPKEAPSLLFLAGIVVLGLRRWRVLPFVLVPFLALAVPIAWWGVRQRFLLVLYPVWWLLVAAGADAFLAGVRRLALRWPVGRTGMVVAAAAVLLGLALGPWRANNAAEAREVQAKNLGRAFAYYQAVHAARTLRGIIAFEHRSSIALALFGEPDRGRGVFADMHLQAPSAEEQWRLLQRWNVRYLVLNGTASDAFPVLAHPCCRERFSLVRTFEHPQQRGGPSRAAIYEVIR